MARILLAFLIFWQRCAHIFAFQNVKRRPCCRPFGRVTQRSVSDEHVSLQAAADALFGGCGFVPDVASLQAWLECAWAAGFDPMGAEQLGRCTCLLNA